MTKTMMLAAGLAAFLAGNAAIAATTSDADSGDTVEIKYDALDSEVPPKPLPAAAGCTLRIAPAVDARQNRETIGMALGAGALLAPDVSPWMTDGLGHLQAFGYKVSAGPVDGAAAADGITMRASVTRAYTWQIGLKIFSMLAVKAEFSDRNGLLQQKYYRAHGDKTNMVGANSEHVTTLNYALNNLLPFVARDLQSLCKGEKVEGYSYAGPDGPQ